MDVGHRERNDMKSTITRKGRQINCGISASIAELYGVESIASGNVELLRNLSEDRAWIDIVRRMTKQQFRLHGEQYDLHYD